jgi:hypothetical protein
VQEIRVDDVALHMDHRRTHGPPDDVRGDQDQQLARFLVRTATNQCLDGSEDRRLTMLSRPVRGFRMHMGRNWYLLGGVEVPVVEPKSHDYSVLGGLMWVF